jgi:TonB family protein
VRLTLLESNRNFLQSTECALLSFLAHAGLVWCAVFSTADGRQMPEDEREARALFLLPPDRVDVSSRQSEVLQWSSRGGPFEDGKLLSQLGEDGPATRDPAYGSRRRGSRVGAKHGAVQFGPMPPFVPDTVFSILEVDEMAERYDSSAAPVYPSELAASGREGSVETMYVVDSTGLVDTATLQVVRSDDPRFTESVRAALGQTRFRPAKKAGKTVRQLVAQQFRFRLEPAPQVVRQIS